MACRKDTPSQIHQLIFKNISKRTKLYESPNIKVNYGYLIYFLLKFEYTYVACMIS